MDQFALRHALAAVVFVLGSALAVQAGCGNGTSVAAASCSSCQESYSSEQCKKWGDLAGCAKAEVSSNFGCGSGFGSACSFVDCEGSPICDDAGSTACVSPDGLTHADCDEIAPTGECSGAKTATFQTEGKMVTGCQFEGCHFRPECPE